MLDIVGFKKAVAGQCLRDKQIGRLNCVNLPVLPDTAFVCTDPGLKAA